MSKTTDISEEDLELFRKAVENTQPLKSDVLIPNKTKPKPNPTKTEEDKHPVIKEMLCGGFEHSSLGRGDELLFYKPGFQKQSLRKLRRGKFNIEAELDLHGMTVDIAKNALSEFLKQCAVQDKRCVRIIHGKGLGSKNKQPIIKNRLNDWLRLRIDVLAFCSARPADGGTGAIYLLLKHS